MDERTPGPDPGAPECPSCRVPLQPIKVLDRIEGVMNAGGFEYAASDARPSAWTGRHPAAGTVHSFMCGSCGLIQLYGRPKA